MKDYYIEGADRYTDATEGRTRISELEMLYKAFRLAKRKKIKKETFIRTASHYNGKY